MYCYCNYINQHCIKIKYAKMYLNSGFMVLLEKQQKKVIFLMAVPSRLGGGGGKGLAIKGRR